jgi:hypothetical protein
MELSVVPGRLGWCFYKLGIVKWVHKKKNMSSKPTKHY